MKIYQILEGLRKDQPFAYMGICTNAWHVARRHNITGTDAILERVMSKWPDHSGDKSFPIADPKKRLAPSSAYGHYETWGKSAYAKKRFELLEFLITELKKENI